MKGAKLIIMALAVICFSNAWAKANPASELVYFYRNALCGDRDGLSDAYQNAIQYIGKIDNQLRAQYDANLRPCEKALSPKRGDKIEQLVWQAQVTRRLVSEVEFELKTPDENRFDEAMPLPPPGKAKLRKKVMSVSKLAEKEFDRQYARVEDAIERNLGARTSEALHEINALNVEDLQERSKMSDAELDRDNDDWGRR